jgi:uncharacterized protein YceH (UPF0502 family)
MEAKLSDTELRVLGVLIEKALTQPAGYPMTLNAITLGANQKQNRDPVVEYSEGDVSAALRTLEHKGLASRAETAIGARAVRFKHLAVEKFKWDRREQAVLAELMLRGRQTAGELRTRASRMTPLPDLQAVGSILEHLKATQPRYVEELPREPGRSANRFRHLLGREEHGLVHPSAAVEESRATLAPPSEAQSGADSGPDSGLFERVGRLEAEVAGLKAIVRELQTKTEDS